MSIAWVLGPVFSSPPIHESGGVAVAVSEFLPLGVSPIMLRSASPTRSVASTVGSTIGSGYVSMPAMPASWKAGPENVLLQCEALCQQILGAVKADVLNVDVAAHQGPRLTTTPSPHTEEAFCSRATVRLPSL